MHKSVFAGAVLALLLAPSLAFGAGFAKQFLFLSKSSVTEGETVLIHAAVNNDTASAFSGTMAFTEGTEKIGTVPVSLDPGEAAVVSVSWKPAAGTHTVTADLKKDTIIVESQSANFSIAAKPVPIPVSNAGSSQTGAAVESSAAIQQEIASLSPATANTVAPAFTLIDGGRSQLSGLIDGQLTVAKQNLGDKSGQVLGTSTVNQAKTDPVGTFWFILWTLYLYLLTVLNFVIGSAGIFYPVLALLVLFFLWRLFTRSRRSEY